MSEAGQPPRLATFPFRIKRGDDVVGMTEVTSTWETIHGLLRFGPDGLVIQWRAARSTDRVGASIRTDREIDPVQEVTVPLSSIAGAEVRRQWSRWPPGHYLIVRAAELKAFEEAAGLSGLRLDHPAELVVRVSRGHLLTAREFAGDVELAVAERAIKVAEGPGSLEAGEEG